MNILEFGDAKLRLKDIDPLYYALHRSDLTTKQKCMFTLAFVTFDHAGIACRVLERGKMKYYWYEMHIAATETLRGAPRRYFRGEVAHKALDALEKRYGTAEEALGALAGTFAAAEHEMKRNWPQFGPTAIFKLCDMVERVCSVPVDFSDVTPAQLMSNSMVTKGVEKAMTSLRAHNEKILFDAMRAHKWATKAGPDYKRPLNMQEYETILCYYSHDDGRNKHLPGNDKVLIRGELEGWGKLADKLIGLLP